MPDNTGASHNRRVLTEWRGSVNSICSRPSGGRLLRLRQHNATNCGGESNPQPLDEEVLYNYGTALNNKYVPNSQDYNLHLENSPELPSYPSYDLSVVSSTKEGAELLEQQQDSCVNTSAAPSAVHSCRESVLVEVEAEINSKIAATGAAGAASSNFRYSSHVVQPLREGSSLQNSICTTSSTTSSSADGGAAVYLGGCSSTSSGASASRSPHSDVLFPCAGAPSSCTEDAEADKEINPTDVLGTNGENLTSGDRDQQAHAAAAGEQPEGRDCKSENIMRAGGQVEEVKNQKDKPNYQGADKKLQSRQESVFTGSTAAAPSIVRSVATTGSNSVPISIFDTISPTSRKTSGSPNTAASETSRKLPNAEKTKTKDNGRSRAGTGNAIKNSTTSNKKNHLHAVTKKHGDSGAQQQGSFSCSKNLHNPGNNGSKTAQNHTKSGRNKLGQNAGRSNTNASKNGASPIPAGSSRQGRSFGNDSSMTNKHQAAAISAAAASATSAAYHAYQMAVSSANGAVAALQGAMSSTAGLHPSSSSHLDTDQWLEAEFSDLDPTSLEQLNSAWRQEQLLQSSQLVHQFHQYNVAAGGGGCVGGAASAAPTAALHALSGPHPWIPLHHPPYPGAVPTHWVQVPVYADTAVGAPGSSIAQVPVYALGGAATGGSSIACSTIAAQGTGGAAAYPPGLEHPSGSRGVASTLAGAAAAAGTTTGVETVGADSALADAGVVPQHMHSLPAAWWSPPRVVQPATTASAGSATAGTLTAHHHPHSSKHHYDEASLRRGAAAQVGTYTTSAGAPPGLSLSSAGGSGAAMVAVASHKMSSNKTSTSTTAGTTTSSGAAAAGATTSATLTSNKKPVRQPPGLCQVEDDATTSAGTSNISSAAAVSTCSGTNENNVVGPPEMTAGEAGASNLMNFSISSNNGCNSSTSSCAAPIAGSVLAGTKSGNNSSNRKQVEVRSRGQQHKNIYGILPSEREKQEELQAATNAQKKKLQNALLEERASSAKKTNSSAVGAGGLKKLSPQKEADSRMNDAKRVLFNNHASTGAPTTGTAAAIHGNDSTNKQTVEQAAKKQAGSTSQSGAAAASSGKSSRPPPDVTTTKNGTSKTKNGITAVGNGNYAMPGSWTASKKGAAGMKGGFGGLFKGGKTVSPPGMPPPTASQYHFANPKMVPPPVPPPCLVDPTSEQQVDKDGTKRKRGVFVARPGQESSTSNWHAHVNHHGSGSGLNFPKNGKNPKSPGLVAPKTKHAVNTTARGMASFPPPPYSVYEYNQHAAAAATLGGAGSGAQLHHHYPQGSHMAPPPGLAAARGGPSTSGGGGGPPQVISLMNMLDNPLRHMSHKYLKKNKHQMLVGKNLVSTNQEEQTPTTQQNQQPQLVVEQDPDEHVSYVHRPHAVVPATTKPTKDYTPRTSAGAAGTTFGRHLLQPGHQHYSAAGPGASSASAACTAGASAAGFGAAGPLFGSQGGVEGGGRVHGGAEYPNKSTARTSGSSNKAGSLADWNARGGRGGGVAAPGAGQQGGEKYLALCRGSNNKMQHSAASHKDDGAVDDPASTSSSAVTRADSSIHACAGGNTQQQVHQTQELVSQQEQTCAGQQSHFPTALDLLAYEDEEDLMGALPFGYGLLFPECVEGLREEWRAMKKQSQESRKNFLDTPIVSQWTGGIEPAAAAMAG
ncbi:unnamed protein product [Amoebophrya sp. A120]|nr:unnamed protein product [Amoebophrya sp. A120]|eukprot:GSA120T00004245001.1